MLTKNAERQLPINETEETILSWTQFGMEKREKRKSLDTQLKLSTAHEKIEVCMLAIFFLLIINWTSWKQIVGSGNNSIN